jgi:hypothetical protein
LIYKRMVERRPSSVASASETEVGGGAMADGKKGPNLLYTTPIAKPFLPK